MNVLLITLDQFRGDCLSSAGHPLVQTPNLDALAAAGMRLDRHYSQAAPCGPGRASLYTGMYQMNTRVVGNGTPLDARFDNIALAARRAGFTPALFGYTDQSVDPREATGPTDPRMQTYTGVLPGFDGMVETDDHHLAWLGWLAGHGFDNVGNGHQALTSEPERPAEFSLSAFLTERALDWLQRQDTGWFVHVSYLRPHPPYAAAGHFSTMYDPAEVPTPITADPLHKFHAQALRISGAPIDETERRCGQAQYYGMISEVDAQLGRLLDWLSASGQWDDTLIVVTADHGDQMGDHGLIEKLGYFDQSYRIVGIVRDPSHPGAHGTVVDEFTENIDIFPTVCEALGLPVPAQCDGLPLTPFLRGESPPWWRTAAHWEYDWRDRFIYAGPHEWPWDRRLERFNLSVLRTRDVQYVQFGDGSSLCFDLATDPTARTLVTDPAVILEQAQAMLAWRAQHLDRTMTDMLVDRGGVGRFPPGVPAAFTTGA